MRLTPKGLFAALGAGMSLAAAGVLALFSVSVVLAVHGWPEVPTVRAGADVALRAATHAASAAASSPGAVRAAGSVVLPRAPRPAPAAPRHDRSSGTRAGHGAAPAPVKVTPAAAPVQVSAPAPAQSQPSAEPRSPVRRLTDNTGQSVQSTTDQLGEAVRPVSQPVANVVEQTGTTLGQTVKNVGELVDGVVGSLLQQPQQQQP